MHRVFLIMVKHAIYQIHKIAVTLFYMLYRLKGLRYAPWVILAKQITYGEKYRDGRSNGNNLNNLPMMPSEAFSRKSINLLLNVPSLKSQCLLLIHGMTPNEKIPA